MQNDVACEIAQYCRRYGLNPETLEYDADYAPANARNVSLLALSRWIGRSGKPSLCVDFINGWESVRKEWFSFSSSFLIGEFEGWWIDMQSESAYEKNPNPPKTIDEAVNRVKELRIPRKIVVPIGGKFVRAVCYW